MMDNLKTYQYLITRKQWISLPNVNTYEDYFMCVIGRQLFLIGDKHLSGSGDETDGSIFMLNLDDQNIEWQLVIKKDFTERTACCFREFNGKIYMIGGHLEYPIDDTLEATNAVDVFDPESNTWESAAPLNQQRQSAGAAALNGLLYVVGGFDSRMKKLASVECYNPEANEWKYVAPLPHPRVSPCVVSHNGLLYVMGVGGESKNFVEGERKYVDIYDPETDIWTSKKTSNKDFMYCKQAFVL